MFIADIYRVIQKLRHQVFIVTLSNIDQYSKVFHWNNQQSVCNKVMITDPTTAQTCQCTTLQNTNVSQVSAATHLMFSDHIIANSLLSLAVKEF